MGSHELIMAILVECCLGRFALALDEMIETYPLNALRAELYSRQFADEIFQFSSEKGFEIALKFDSQCWHWFKWRLGAIMHQPVTWSNVGFNEFNKSQILYNTKTNDMDWRSDSLQISFNYGLIKSNSQTQYHSA